MNTTAVGNNKNKRLPASSKVRSVLFSVILVHHTYAIIAVIAAVFVDIPHMPAELQRKLINHVRLVPLYITTWNFLSQWIYVAIELALIYLPSAKYSKLLEKYNWTHFLSVVWPTTLYIMSVFWSLYNIDRELILPKYVDILFPTYLNHSMHTAIGALLILETLTTQKNHLPSMALPIKINLVYMTVYCFILNYTFVYNGQWTYPFFHYMTDYQRCLFYIASFASTQILLQIGYFFVGFRCRAMSLIRKPSKKLL